MAQACSLVLPCMAFLCAYGLSACELLGIQEVCMQIYPTQEHPTFDGALAAFLAEPELANVEVESCCIACAGPVSNNACTMTNLHWQVDGDAVQQHHGFPCAVCTPAAFHFSVKNALCSLMHTMRALKAAPCKSLLKLWQLLDDEHWSMQLSSSFVSDAKISQRCKHTPHAPNQMCPFHPSARSSFNSVQVLNDFVAVGYAIPLFDPAKLTAVHAAPRDAGGPIAVLGPGTGLGEVQLVVDEGRDEYKALASEGSHAGFAPRGEKQRELLAFAEAELEPLPCEVEHVACGSGLRRIHRFVCHKAGQSHRNLVRCVLSNLSGVGWTQAWECCSNTAKLCSPLHYALRCIAAMRRACSPRRRRKINLVQEPQDITERALDGSCAHCGNAVDMFLDIVGAEAGAMGLRLLATGGIFVAGGILPKMLPKLSAERADRLRRAYLNEKSRFTTQLQKWPLFVLREEAGLRGVFHYAMTMAKRVEQRAASA